MTSSVPIYYTKRQLNGHTCIHARPEFARILSRQSHYTSFLSALERPLYCLNFKLGRSYWLLTHLMCYFALDYKLGKPHW